MADRKLMMEEMGRVNATDYRARMQVRVVLDDVRSRHNVGSIFRSGDSFGIEGIDLCGFTPCPPHREIDKTALGATEAVPWAHFGQAEDRVKALQHMGYKVFAVEQTVQAVPMQQLDLTVHQPLALVFGNELSGVSEGVIAACDGCLVIPQFGTKHSLNVSVCAGIVLWWFAGRDR
jgi:23S rRNA (guanosine2251-2'-O)-methyltransferase